MKPSMRITRVDLDEEEMPETVYVRMTWDVYDRLCRDRKALRDRALPDRPAAEVFADTSVSWWADSFPITWVASVAKHYGCVPIDDAGPESRVAQEIYRCLSSFCCRFWEDGADGVPGASESTP